MQHEQSSVKVFFKNDYTLFRMLNGNRQLNEHKMKSIIKEIEAGNDMLQYYPIQVKENEGRLDILDGQHRFMISLQLERPIFYICVQEQKSMLEIAKVNTNVEKWKAEDFINCYIQLGSEHYKELQQFVKKYGISLSVARMLLHSGEPGNEGMNSESTEAFKTGTFEVKQKAAAEEIAELCMLFEPFANWRARAFIIAIFRIKKAGLVTIQQLADAYKANPEMLKMQANYKSYIYNLEQIFNVRKQKRIPII